ncbi:hypothetical protein J4444_02150 [Candidatus Woesearchaeota archaeon]|nr:hypothetical protein [Candidatus Woesearchaeota archaeon]
MSNITLVGIEHYTGEGFGRSGNYQFVQNILESSRPDVVTAEVKIKDVGYLFERYTLKGNIFTSDKRSLRRIETRIKNRGNRPPIGSEYLAAVIYCRRNSLPLHFIDLGPATLDEVVSTDIIKTDLNVFIEDQESLFKLNKKRNPMPPRNKFMVTALKRLVENIAQI